MKRVLGFVSVVEMAVLVQGEVLAQTNPIVGTWNMNVEKSKDTPRRVPKSLTLTMEAGGEGVKDTSQALGVDGTSISWGYTANLDGKDNPITGTGAPGGADTIALKHISANKTEAILKKGGNVVRTAWLVVSKDGKVLEIMAKGKDPDGKAAKPE